jgi:putative membrane protein
MMWGPYGGYGSYGPGASGWMMGFMALFWVLVIVGIVLVLRALMMGGRMGHMGPGGHMGGMGMGGGSERALSILHERYAKGEITKEQYDQMKRDITG